MKITYLSNSIIPSKAANSVHVMKMCQAFAKNGHSIQLFARAFDDGSIKDLFNYYGVDKIFNLLRIQLPRIKGRIWIYAFRVNRCISKDDKPDLFYGRSLECLFFATYFKKPLIYEVHNTPKNRFYYFLTWLLLKNKNFSKLVTISNSLKKEYLRIFRFLSEDDIIVAHDGADAPIFIDEKKPFKNSSITTKVGYIGQLYPGKGMEIITSIAPRLSNIEFHVVGGTDSDIKYWEEKSKSTNIIFHGYVPHGELSNYYDDFDIMLAPFQKSVSVHGGRGEISRWMSPLKIFEYMSQSKPIISSDLEVLKEILEDRKNSLLCSPDNPEEWISAIEYLVNNPRFMKDISTQAFNDFIENYTWNKRIKSI